MKESFVSKILCLVLISALIICAVPIVASAESGFKGYIEKVDLAVEREPYIDSSSNQLNRIKFSASVAGETTAYEVGAKKIQYSQDYKNGVAWFDETEGYYVTDPKYPLYTTDYNFHLIHEYRVEIVVRITGNVIHEGSWFKAYADGENWNSAVTATINGHEATVSPYLDYSVGECLLISYTFAPTLPNNPYDIRIIESCIDAPRGGRVASFDASAGGYQRYYGVNYSVNSTDTHHGVAWWDNTDLRYVCEGEAFVTGHTYTVAIYLKVDNDFYQSFYQYPKVFLNGNEARLRKTLSSSTTQCILEYTFNDIREAPADYMSF